MSPHLFASDDGALYDTRLPDWSHKPLRALYRKQCAEIETLADLKATLRAGQWTDLGGYPLYFIAADGEAISFDALRQNWREVCQAFHPRGFGTPCRFAIECHHGANEWQPVYCRINYEDASLYCAHTGKRIPSAYAEDEGEEA